MSSDTLSKKSIDFRISHKAISAIVGNETDTIAAVKIFFKHLGNQKNYSIISTKDTSTVTINPGGSISAGPSISISNVNANWKIEDIIFGK